MSKTTERSSNLPKLSMADEKAFSTLSHHFNEFLEEHSEPVKGSKSNRRLDPETFEEIFAVSGRLGFCHPHLPTLNEERGRTGYNYKKGNSKNWALDKPAVPVWLKEAFLAERTKDLKESGYTRPPAEMLYMVPWNDVPQGIKDGLYKGDSYTNGNGEEVKIPHKIRRPYRDTDPVFVPKAVALLIRRKKDQDWFAPQWLVLGVYGPKCSSKKEPVVMSQALIWERSSIPKLVETIGAPETAIPSIFTESREEPESSKAKGKTKKADNDEYEIEDVLF
jgi:hypothetical protein